MPVRNKGMKSHKYGLPARGAFALLIGNVVKYPIVIGTAVLVARVLGPSDRGIYAFILLLETFALPISFFGFGAAVLYFTGSGRFGVKESTFTYICVGVLLGAILGIVLAVMFRFDALGKTAKEVPATLFYVALLKLPVEGGLIALDRLVVGTSWFSLYNWARLGKNILRSLLLLICVGLFGLGLAGAIGCLVISSFIVFLSFLIAFWKRFRPELVLNFRIIREGFHYGLKAYIGQLAVRANLRVDQFIIGISASAEVLGVYAVAITASEFLQMMTGPVNMVLFNRIAGSKVEKDRRYITDQVHRVMFLTKFLSVIIAAPCGYFFIPIVFGQEYAAASTLFMLLLPGAIVTITPNIITKYFSGIGMVGTSSMIYIIGMGIGMVFYGTFIPLFGSLGAAFACSLTYISVALASVFLYRRAIRPERDDLFSFRYSDFAWAQNQIIAGLQRWK